LPLSKAAAAAAAASGALVEDFSSSHEASKVGPGPAVEQDVDMETDSGENGKKEAAPVVLSAASIHNRVQFCEKQATLAFNRLLTPANEKGANLHGCTELRESLLARMSCLAWLEPKSNVNMPPAELKAKMPADIPEGSLGSTDATMTAEEDPLVNDNEKDGDEQKQLELLDGDAIKPSVELQITPDECHVIVPERSNLRKLIDHIVDDMGVRFGSLVALVYRLFITTLLRHDKSKAQALSQTPTENQTQVGASPAVEVAAQFDASLACRKYDGVVCEFVACIAKKYDKKNRDLSSQLRAHLADMATQIPVLTSTCLQAIAHLCGETQTNTLGLHALWRVAEDRVPARRASLAWILWFTTHEEKGMRQNPIQLVANKLFPQARFSEDIALYTLGLAQSMVPPEDRQRPCFQASDPMEFRHPKVVRAESATAEKTPSSVETVGDPSDPHANRVFGCPNLPPPPQSDPTRWTEPSTMHVEERLQILVGLSAQQPKFLSLLLLVYELANDRVRRGIYKSPLLDELCVHVVRVGGLKILTSIESFLAAIGDAMDVIATFLEKPDEALEPKSSTKEHVALAINTLNLAHKLVASMTDEIMKLKKDEKLEEKTQRQFTTCVKDLHARHPTSGFLLYALVAGSAASEADLQIVHTALIGMPQPTKDDLDVPFKEQIRVDLVKRAYKRLYAGGGVENEPAVSFSVLAESLLTLDTSALAPQVSENYIHCVDKLLRSLPKSTKR
jgi:hypothetical protein